MKQTIRQATTADIDGLVEFYDDMTVYLERTENYPVWKRHVYPARHNIQAAVQNGEIFMLEIDGEVAAAVILNSEQPPEYAVGSWKVQASGSEIVVVHALGVHYNYYRMGLAGFMMNFVREYAGQRGAKAVRLDAAVGNSPAIALYEKLGYTYAGDTVLHPENEGDIPVRLYEMPIKETDAVMN